VHKLKLNTSHSQSEESGAHSGQFEDPVFKKLSRINGEINRLTKDQIKAKLAEFRLDTR
jgi:3'-5' exoribonuclease 1